MLLSPTGTFEISSTTLESWTKSKGLSPCDCLDSYESELESLAKSDPATVAEIAENDAFIASKKADEESKELEISRITGGLDRETVMALAKKALHDARGYFPLIYGDTLVVKNTSDEKIVWAIGDEKWSNPISTRGNRDDDGAGYGLNTLQNEL